MHKKIWNADLRSIRRVGQVREDPVTGDARPAEMGTGYGIRSIPTTFPIDPVPTIFVLGETVLLFDLFGAPSRSGVPTSLYR